MSKYIGWNDKQCEYWARVDVLFNQGRPMRVKNDEQDIPMEISHTVSGYGGHDVRPYSLGRTEYKDIQPHFDVLGETGRRLFDEGANLYHADDRFEFRGRAILEEYEHSDSSYDRQLYVFPRTEPKMRWMKDKSSDNDLTVEGKSVDMCSPDETLQGHTNTTVLKHEYSDSSDYPRYYEAPRSTDLMPWIDVRTPDLRKIDEVDSSDYSPLWDGEEGKEALELPIDRKSYDVLPPTNVAMRVALRQRIYDEDSEPSDNSDLSCFDPFVRWVWVVADRKTDEKKIPKAGNLEDILDEQNSLSYRKYVEVLNNSEKIEGGIFEHYLKAIEDSDSNTEISSVEVTSDLNLPFMENVHTYTEAMLIRGRDNDGEFAYESLDENSPWFDPRDTVEEEKEGEDGALLHMGLDSGDLCCKE